MSPLFLIDLFCDISNKFHKNFKKTIRQINNSVSFASFSAKYVGNASQFTNNIKAPYCLRIDGHIYHNVANNLFGDIDIDPSYCQLYVLDSELANEVRLKHPANK